MILLRCVPDFSSQANLTPFKQTSTNATSLSQTEQVTVDCITSATKAIEPKHWANIGTYIAAAAAAAA